MPENDNIDTSFGDLAQLVEHTAHIRDVIGSIPMAPIKACISQAFFLFEILITLYIFLYNFIFFYIILYFFKS